jgi:hypothetical protein
MADPQLPILIFVRDLLFSTRIVEAARDAGVPFKVVRKTESLAAEPGRLLMIDLNQEGAIDAAREWKYATGSPTLGFVSHVDTETIARAKSGGIDRVMSRGQFTQLLPELVKG